MVEFQIRTREMHRIAEEGIAAHWNYKEGKAFNTKNDKQVVWLRSYLIEQKDKDSAELVESLKEDILTKQMFIYTPAGESIELPQGATPLDFAYAIHSKVGDQCTGAKVNGRMVNLKYRLKSGEKVEIITNSAQEPKRDWLNFVKTARAKSRIRAFLRKKDSEKAIASGTDRLEKEFNNRGVSFKEFVAENPINLQKALDKFSIRTLDELLTNVGFSKLSPLKVLHVFFPSDDKYDDTAYISNAAKQSSKEPFYIDGVDGVMTKIAKCCTPVPGDEVQGYISTGRGVIVHQSTCPNLAAIAINEDRLVPVVREVKEGYVMPAKLKIITENILGGLNAITGTISDMGVNMTAHNHKSTGDRSEHLFILEIRSKEELDLLMNKIGQLKNVKSVRKV
jgi:GTP pyrophosphokinase